MRNVLLILLGLIAFLSGCTKVTELTGLGKPPAISCAETLIDQAYGLYGEAKLELARHYDNRDSSHLFDAYYAALDSVLVARSVAKCPDRQKNDIHAIRNITKLNRTLQRIVRLNMRDDDPRGLLSVYRNQYELVIPNDIK